MSKANPLFVDSTKLSSDSIGTRFELMGMALDEGQSLYIRVKDSKGNEESSQMKLSDESDRPGDPLFHTKLWLNHQQDIVYQFLVMGAEGVERSSKFYHARATYILEDEWVTITEEQMSEPSPFDAKEEGKSSESDVDDLGELSMLIDKWGL